MLYYASLAGLVKQIYTFFNLFFETMMQDMVMPMLDVLAEYVLGFSMRIGYLVMMALMLLLDLLQPVMGALAGNKKVDYEGKGDYLINIILYQSGISKALWVIVLIAMIIAVAFSVSALLGGTLKGGGEQEEGGASPIKVLIKTSKVMLMFLIVPVLSIAAINISLMFFDKTSEMISIANGGSSETKLSSVIFMVSTTGAQRNKDYSKNSAYDYTSEVKYKYYRGERKYYDLLQVEKDFYIVRMQFLPGIIAALFFIYVYISVSLVFVYFIAQILFLLVVSPFFVAAIVMDDGIMFKKWRDLYLTRLIAGLGLIASVRIYEAVILPIFTSDSFRFLPVVPAVSDIIGPEYFPDILIKVLFLVLFGKAVTKSHTIITSIINEEAAKEEQKVADFVRDASIKAAKKAAEVAVDVVMLVAAVAVGIFTAGAGTAGVGAAAGAAKGGVVAAKGGMVAAKGGAAATKGAATAGKVGAKAGAQAAKTTGKQIGKEIGKQVGKKVKSEIKNKAVNTGKQAASKVANTVKSAGSDEPK